MALSTVEAEYLAMTLATKEVLWLQNFLHEIGMDEFLENPVKIGVDNQGAICLSKNKITSERSKHIDVRCHFLRQQVRDKKINFVYVPTSGNVADSLTKVLPKGKAKDHQKLMGLMNSD